jgi:hypothetical protein
MTTIREIPMTNPETQLWVMENLISQADCTNLINRANQLQTDTKGNKSWHQPGTGGQYSRVIMIDPKLANNIWTHIKPFLPKELNGYKLLYLNSHFRFSRYRKDGIFPLHCDGKNYDSSRPDLTAEYSAESLLTLNIFLNSEGDYDLVGGGTSFFNRHEDGFRLRTTVKAQAGRAALFWADQYHRGDLVGEGFKYLLRTDVMGVKI